jgi:signal transduction histidine kinase
MLQPPGPRVPDAGSAAHPDPEPIAPHAPWRGVLRRHDRAEVRAEIMGRVAQRPATGDGIFSDRLRRAGIVWVAITLPLAALTGLFVDGESPYLVAWVLCSGLSTTPALVVTWIASHRVNEPDRRFWRIWLLGLAIVYSIGLSMLALLVTGFEPLRQFGGFAVVSATLVFGFALVTMMRSRSGSRALTIDVIEVGMLQVALVALGPLVIGDEIIRSANAWFTLPAAMTAVALLCSFCWALTLFARLDGRARTVEGLGVALGLIGALTAILQVAEGLSGFTLNESLLLVLQTLCMGLVLLTPLHLPKETPLGLDRLPPQQQVREYGLLSSMPVILLGVLFGEMVIVRDQVPWAALYFAAVAFVLLTLATVRHLLATRETKRLYARVEAAAEDRRHLLAEVLRSADHDRHRVAAQLHEQAIASYSAFAWYMHSAAAGREESARPNGALTRVRDDLALQAESLRQLMLAIQPIDSVRPAAQSLGVPISAYVDSIYGDAPAPAFDLTVDDGLAMDWTTETIAFRIVQEALRNACTHANARRIAVSIAAVDDVIEVRVEDDGDGFDPDTALFESGIATMRSFAALSGGHITVRSARGAGTVVVARLGGDDPDDLAPAAPVTPRPEREAGAAGPVEADAPRLRLVPAGAPNQV